MKPNENDINLIWASCQNNPSLLNGDASRFAFASSQRDHWRRVRSSNDLSESTSTMLKQNASTKSTMGSLDEISLTSPIDSSLLRPLSSGYLRKYSYLTMEDISTVNEEEFLMTDSDYFNFLEVSASDDTMMFPQRDSLSLLRSSGSRLMPSSSFRGSSSADGTETGVTLLSDPSTYPAFTDSTFRSTPNICDETSFSMLLPSSLETLSSSLRDASTSTDATTHLGRGTAALDSTVSATDVPALSSKASCTYRVRSWQSMCESRRSDTLCSDGDASSDFSLLGAFASYSNESSTSSPNALFSYIRESTSTASITLSSTTPPHGSASFDLWMGNVTPRPGRLSLAPGLAAAAAGTARGAAAAVVGQPWSQRVERRVRFAPRPSIHVTSLSRSSIARKLDRHLQAVSLNVARASAVKPHNRRKAGNIFLRKSFGETQFLKSKSTTVQPAAAFPAHLLLNVPPRKPAASRNCAPCKQQQPVLTNTDTPAFRRLTAFTKRALPKKGGQARNSAWPRDTTQPSPSPPNDAKKQDTRAFLRLTAPRKIKVEKTDSWSIKAARDSDEDSAVFQRLTSNMHKSTRMSVPPISLLIRLARNNRFKNIVQRERRMRPRVATSFHS